MKAAAQIFCLAGIGLALSVAPDLTWLDAGELAAASWELGIAHPPGFPVFAMMHKAVSLCLPIGDIAFRGNLASGLIASLSLAVWFSVLRLWGISKLAAAIGVMGTGCATGFVLHATTVEVYSGLSLMAGVLLLGVIHCLQNDDQRSTIAVCFGLGLAVGGHHPELRLVAVLLMGYLLVRTRRTMGHYLAMGSSLAMGLMVIVYLPIRAYAGPWRNWGDPSSLVGLWDHFWGARIRAAYAGEMGSDVFGAITTLSEQAMGTAPILVFAGLIGIGLAVKRKGGWLIAAILILEIFYSTVINPMGLRDWQNGVLLWCLLGVGAAILIDAVGPIRPFASWLSAVLIVGGSIMAYPSGQTWSDDVLRSVSNEALDQMPPETLCLVGSDNSAASLIYRQVVEGSRPDIGLIIRQHVAYPSSVSRVFERHPRMLAGWSPGSRLSDLTNLDNKDWPLAWEWTTGFDAKERPNGLRPVFPFFVRGYDSEMHYAKVLGENISGLKTSTQPNPGRTHLANLSSDLGRFSMATAQVSSAVSAFKTAVEIETLSAKRWDNLGAALSASGQFDSAIEASEQALMLKPGFRPAQINRARYLIAKSDWSEAIKALDGVLHNGDDAEAFALRGVAQGNLGQLEAAERDFDSALKLDPRQPEARSGKDLILRSKRNEAGQ